MKLFYCVQERVIFSYIFSFIEEKLGRWEIAYSGTCRIPWVTTEVDSKCVCSGKHLVFVMILESLIQRQITCNSDVDPSHTPDIWCVLHLLLHQYPIFIFIPTSSYMVTVPHLPVIQRRPIQQSLHPSINLACDGILQWRHTIFIIKINYLRGRL